MNVPSRIKTCCTKCGDPIGNTFSMTTDYQIVINKKPIFCDDCQRLEFNDFCYISPNKLLSGPANPKTKIPPVIAPPISDLSYWKTNNLITHSHINSQSQQPLYESGFFETSTCDTKKCLVADNFKCDYAIEKKHKHNQKHKELPYSKENFVEHLTSSQKNYLQSISREQDKRDINITRNLEIQKNVDKNYSPNVNINIDSDELLNKVISGYRNQDVVVSDIKPIDPVVPISDVSPCCIPQDINITCGYNRQNPFLYGLPTNYAAGNCEKDVNMKNYNDNLFTQTLQPGIYTKTQVVETPNSNIGISFAQPFEPVTVNNTNCGKMFTQIDPNLITDVIEPNTEFFEEPNIYNVYDPRCNGYGTSYRAYNDDLTGQTRFMYDDIDAIRNPNYISRSHIDTLPFADKYGPMQPCGMEGNINTGQIREMVNQSFTNSTNNFRSELQERLMRKNNAVAWQRRQAPISTGGFCAK